MNITIPLVVNGAAAFALGAWFLRANRTWTSMLRTQDPRLAYDPVRNPVAWVTGSQFRVATWLTRLRSTDDRADIEFWRIRTLNRFAVWVGLTMAALIGSDLAVTYVADFVRASIDRYSDGFGILLVVVLAAILGYYVWQLARTLRDFGNGRRPTFLEVAIALGGIVVALGAMAIMPFLDLSKAGVT